MFHLFSLAVAKKIQVFGEAVKLAKLRKNHKSFIHQISSTSEAKTILTFIFLGLQVYGRHLEV